MNQCPALSAPVAHVLERRRVAERRKFNWRTFFYGACYGQRAYSRRQVESGLPYVDRSSPQLFISAVGLIVFCCLDAFFTLTLMAYGAHEINPLMDAVIRHDAESFLWVKIGMTAAGLMLLVPFQNVQLVRGIQIRSLIYALFAGYACLVGYELALLRVL